MRGELTLAELDQQVAAIGDDTTRRLQLVPYEGHYGDWNALAQKHREMLAILETARLRLGELQPPADRAEAYRSYLDGLDRQLVLERAVLDAAEAADMDAYRSACRTLARVLDDIRSAGRRAGLRSTRPVLRRRLWVWVTLAWYLVRAYRHARAEQRAGRRWR